MEKASRPQALALFHRSVRFRLIAVIAVFELSGRQSVEPGRMLVEEAPGLKMQLTAEQFTYRAFHARETRIIGLRLASPAVIFLLRKNVSFRNT
jgi:hypothetical protein